MLDKAAMRLTQRIALASDDLPQAQAEEKFDAIARHDTELTINFEAGTVTLHVAGEPLFTCLASYLYGDNYRELLAALADDALPDLELADA